MTIYTNNALRPVAGNLYVPDSMEARGNIKPLPPVNGTRNGAGLMTLVGLWGYEWRFKSMVRTEMQWWMNLVGYLNSPNFQNFSKSFVKITGATPMPACRLWLIDTAIAEFDYCVIDVPTWQEYKNGRYYDVLVKFSSMKLAP